MPGHRCRRWHATTRSSARPSPVTADVCSPPTATGSRSPSTIPSDAVDAAVESSAALAAEPWPDGHAASGADGPRNGAALSATASYPGPVLNRAARIMAAAHGGQVLVGARTASLLDGVDSSISASTGFRTCRGPERLFQVVRRRAPAEFPRLRTVDAHRGNLPHAERASSAASRCSPTSRLVRAHRLVTLTGVGGVGKTRLARRGRRRARRRVPRRRVDGRARVGRPTQPRCPTRSRPRWASPRRRGAPVVHTRGRRALRAAAAARARQLRARRGRRGRRRRRSARDGRRRRSPGHVARGCSTSPGSNGDSGPAARRSTAARASPAVTLFVERAHALQSRIDFAEPATAAAVVEICRSLDGLPLGIELAAARTISMSPIDIRDRLGDRFRILTSSQHALARQQTLRDVVAWSYELLDDDERDAAAPSRGVLGRVRSRRDHRSARRRPTTLDVLDLPRLAGAQVTRDRRRLARARTRYALLETIRQFAEGELAAPGSLDAARDRHAELLRRRGGGSAGRDGTVPSFARLRRLDDARARQPPRRRSAGAGRAATSRPRPTSPRTRP